jgi:hypothetical protein
MLPHTATTTTPAPPHSHLRRRVRAAGLVLGVALRTHQEGRARGRGRGPAAGHVRGLRGWRTAGLQRALHWGLCRCTACCLCLFEEEQGLGWQAGR